MLRNRSFCKRMPLRKIFKLNKGGADQATPQKQGQQGQNPNALPICAQDAGSGPTCTSPGAGGLTTIEYHKSPRGVKRVKKENKGKEVSYHLKGEQERVNHWKKREGEKQSKDKRVVISKGAQYHNPNAVTRLIGPRNIAKVEINGVKTRALMDSGSQVNMMTEKFLKKCGINHETIDRPGVEIRSRRVCRH